MTDTPSPDDHRFADAAFAQVIFETQLRQLERTGDTAQALLTAVTIPAAVGGPLVVIGLERNAFGYALLVLIVLYIVSLGLAVRACLAVIYTPHGDAPVGESVLHYRHIANRGSPGAYADEVVALSDSSQIAAVLQDSYVVSRIVTTKANQMAPAIRYTQGSLAVLGLMIIGKALAYIAT